MKLVAWLRAFNEIWDVFILEAIKPLAIISMGLGTIAIFNLQGLAIQAWFVALWAIVQAASIDGLFFATWDRLFNQKLRWSNALAIISLSFIGFTLALIAIAINTVLGFQVLWAIADSSQAMLRLGISSELFTSIRAVLAIVVFIMISFVRARARATEEAKANTKQATPVKAKTTVRVVEASPKAIPEVATTLSHSPKIVNHDLNTVAIDQANGTTKYELIKEAMAKALERGDKLNYKAISAESGAGYSTVKLYAPKIKRELEGK